MTKIKSQVDHILDEVCGAKDYAECYVESKAKGNTQWANRYKEMAQDELKHANYLHEKVVADIEELKNVYTPPQEMMDKWEHDHKEYVDKAAWVKQMLTM